VSDIEKMCKDLNIDPKQFISSHIKQKQPRQFKTNAIKVLCTNCNKHFKAKPNKSIICTTCKTSTYIKKC